MIKKDRNYEESLIEALQDPQEALAYLNTALIDEDQRVFLLALKDVLTAQDIDISNFIKEAAAKQGVSLSEVITAKLSK